MHGVDLRSTEQPIWASDFINSEEVLEKMGAYQNRKINLKISLLFFLYVNYVFNEFSSFLKTVHHIVWINLGVFANYDWTCQLKCSKCASCRATSGHTAIKQKHKRDRVKEGHCAMLWLLVYCFPDWTSHMQDNIKVYSVNDNNPPGLSIST